LAIYLVFANKRSTFEQNDIKAKQDTMEQDSRTAFCENLFCV